MIFSCEVRKIHIRLLKTNAFFISFCLFVWLISGCTPADVTPPPADETLPPATETQPPRQNEPGTVTLTPVDLFEGDKAKFQLFLGNLAGAFKLRYDGQKTNVRLVVENWENGKYRSQAFSVDDLFQVRDNRHDLREIEVIVTFETSYRDEGRKTVHTVKVGSVRENGTTVSSFSYEEGLEDLKGFSPISYNEPQTFAAKGAVPVYGIQGTRSDMIRTVSLTPEDLSQLEWGLILFLHFDEP